MSVPAGVVLVGGASSRMGTDKAFVEIEGRPMVLVVADALRAGGCDPVSCQGGDRDRLERLGLVVRADTDGGGPGGPSVRPGPVRAIADALATATVPTVVIAACDLPGLTGEVVATLVRVSTSHDAPAVAITNGRRHLVSAWPAAAHTSVVGAMARGTSSYRELLSDLGAIDVEVDPRAVHNVNRPEELPGATPGGRYPRSPMTVPEISVDELAPLLRAGARIVDVREPGEYEQARVPGGSLVPLATVPDHVDAFRGDGTTYVICRSGVRSMRACEFLAQQGIDVANVAGGVLAWIDSGRDVESGPA